MINLFTNSSIGLSVSEGWKNASKTWVFKGVLKPKNAQKFKSKF